MVISLLKSLVVNHNFIVDIDCGLDKELHCVDKLEESDHMVVINMVKHNLMEHLIIEGIVNS